jgi:hypothetical protein
MCCGELLLLARCEGTISSQRSFGYLACFLVCFRYALVNVLQKRAEAPLRAGVLPRSLGLVVLKPLTLPFD